MEEDSREVENDEFGEQDEEAENEINNDFSCVRILPSKPIRLSRMTDDWYGTCT